MHRPIVLGGSGFVGGELADYFQCPRTSLSRRSDYIQVDATETTQLRSELAKIRPDFVLNCVGLADVDRAEKEPALAAALNCKVVENLVAIHADLGFQIVQISTDYVFDGSRGNYRETDATNPVNEYGRSKLLAEGLALKVDSSLIVRISSPFGRGFGARKTQFFKFVAESLSSGQPVLALRDQRVTATYLPDLARAIETLTDQSISGIVHIGSREPRTRFEFAQTVADAIGADPSLVKPAYRSEMKQWAAARPADTTLNVENSIKLGVSYTSVGAAVATILATTSRPA